MVRMWCLISLCMSSGAGAFSQNSPTNNVLEPATKVFESVCVDTLGYADAAHQRILTLGGEREPNALHEDVFQGVKPKARAFYRLPSEFVALGFAGQITSEARRLLGAGIASETRQIDPEIRLDPLIGLYPPDAIGLRYCRVMSQTKNPTQSLFAFQSYLNSAWGAREPKEVYISHRKSSSSASQNSMWDIDGVGRVHFVEHAQDPGTGWSVFELSLSNIVFKDDDKLTYSLD